jgi:DNA-binding NarL/FixJ family response regulator
MALRCLIVDDNDRFAEIATDLLTQQGITVVGTASTSEEALRRVEQLRPDVTLVDIDLGAESGFEVVRRLAEGAQTRDSRTILISSHAAWDYVELIEASEALGFVPKSELSAQAITDVMARETGESPKT